MFSHSNLIVNGGTFKLNHPYSSRAIDDLKAATAPAAFHNSRDRFDPPKCHPHTREAVLKKIMEWIQRKIDTRAFVMWLYGAAGAGKSAIAQTIAEICHKEGLLLASFFFSRSDTLCNTTKRLVATLVYQIIVAIPSVRGLVETAIENDPLIFSRSLDAHFATLIADPLEQLRETAMFAQKSPPALIILDGLDECIDGTRAHLLDVISEFPQVHGLVFLIVSRPEQDISMAIRFEKMEQFLTQIALDTEYQSREDVEIFFRDKFDQIKRTHPLRAQIPSSWPDYATIRTLVAKSSGQFIYAATALRYISSPRHRPTGRLDVILGISPPINENDVPFAQLDALYTHIISSSEDPPQIVRIISACLLILYMPLPAVEDFLGLPRGDGILFLAELASIIGYDPQSEHIRILHASLGEFLFDVSRSRQFHVDPQTMHTNISRWYLSRIIQDKGVLPIAHPDAGGEMWMNAGHHCRLARATPQLINDIRSTLLRDKFEASLKRFDTNALTFLERMNDMKFEGAKLLYAEYLSIYDKNFVSYLDKNPHSCLELIHFKDCCLLGLVGFYDPYGRVPTVEAILLRVFGRILKSAFKNELRFISFLLADRKTYIYDFFGDKTRSGFRRHAVQDSHYTMSAEKCAEYLLDRHYIPIQGLHPWASQSRKRPWLCRKRHPAVKSIRQHWIHQFRKVYVKPYRKDGDSWVWTTEELPLEPLLVVHIVLVILPPLLAHTAQGSTNLDTLCKQLISKRLPSFIFPKECEVAKRAIEEYLIREEGRFR